MKIEKEKLTIDLDIEFGSDFQKQVFVGSLKAVLETLQQSFQDHHQKNKIDFHVQWLNDRKLFIKEPNIHAINGRDGEQQEIEKISLEFMRDIDIFYHQKYHEGFNEKGEHVAMIPIKVSYKRKKIS